MTETSVTSTSKPREVVGVIGTGAMGAGIVELAIVHGHSVFVHDESDEALLRLPKTLQKHLNLLVQQEKLRTSEIDRILQRVTLTPAMADLQKCDIVIESIPEDLQLKRELLQQLEKVVRSDCLIATNTSSLPITALANTLQHPERALGLHFFHPVPETELVEIVGGLLTSGQVIVAARALINSWQKTTVLAKDTPGFVVNRIANIGNLEALRLVEESVANVSRVDWAMREVGGFRRGPFEHMDLQGIDVAYSVAQSIFQALHYDPRYQPSLLQQRLVEAKRLGKKTKGGFYDYSGTGSPEVLSQSREDYRLAEKIVFRILSMICNEAIHLVFQDVATVHDIDLAMTRSFHFPVGPLKWADEIGLKAILRQLNELREYYEEERYRPSPLLKQMVGERRAFYPR